MSTATLPRTAKYNPVTRRHSWLKIRDHFRECTFCGMQKETRQDFELSAAGGLSSPVGHPYHVWYLDATFGTDRDRNKIPTCDGRLVQ